MHFLPRCWLVVYKLLPFKFLFILPFVFYFGKSFLLFLLESIFYMLYNMFSYICGCNLVVECHASDLIARVRFPPSAPFEINLRTEKFVSFFIINNLQKRGKNYQNNLILFFIFLNVGIKSMSSQHWIYTPAQILIWKIPIPLRIIT